MIDLVWCRSCGLPASLVQAALNEPCSRCGSVSYLSIDDSSEEDALLSLSERMQRIGQWDIAEAAFRRCFDLGFISAADLNLSLRQLSWRKECVSAAVDAVRSAPSPIFVEDLKAALADFDEYTLSWLLSEFSGLRLVPSESGFIIEELSYGESKA